MSEFLNKNLKIQENKRETETMEELVEKLTKQIQKLHKQQKDYSNTRKEEILIDDQTIEECTLLENGESILDRQMTEKHRIVNLSELKTEIEITINVLSNQMSKTSEWIENEDGKITNKINETIETMKNIRQRKADKDKKANQSRKRTTQGECEDDNEELEKTLKNFKEEREILSKNRNRELSELTGMEIEEILFDSTIHSWDSDESEFAERIEGHKNICVVIEDRKGNVFGGYSSKQIELNKYLFDTKSYLFSIKRNKKYSLKKYPLKNMNAADFIVYINEFDVLFTFGAEITETNLGEKDIVVYKKDLDIFNFCNQHSYEYYGEEDALCDNRTDFEIEKLFVY